jgi:PPM family protein phosphatase
VLVLALAGIVAYRWSQQQYYVAAHGDRVAIFRGVQASIPGFTMNRVAQDTPVTIAALESYPAEQVRAGIQADSLGDARKIVARLTDGARVCPTPTPTPTPTPSPSPTAKPSGTATKKPAASQAPSPTISASPTPTPSPTLAPPDCLKTTT